MTLSLPLSCVHEREVLRVEKKEEVKVEKQYPQADFLRTLSGRGDFEAAEKRNLDTLARAPKAPPADEALYRLGLIYAHHANPGKDYRKALTYFTRLAEQFPDSPLAAEAGVWIGVLEDISRALEVDISIEEKKKELSK